MHPTPARPWTKRTSRGIVHISPPPHRLITGARRRRLSRSRKEKLWESLKRGSVNRARSVRHRNQLSFAPETTPSCQNRPSTLIWSPHRGVAGVTPGGDAEVEVHQMNVMARPVWVGSRPHQADLLYGQRAEAYRSKIAYFGRYGDIHSAYGYQNYVKSAGRNRRVVFPDKRSPGASVLVIGKPYEINKHGN